MLTCKNGCKNMLNDWNILPDRPPIIGSTFMIFGVNKTRSNLRRITRVLVFGITLSVANLHAANTDSPISASWTLESLMQVRSSIQESNAWFKEDKTVDAFTEGLHLEGTFFYRSPNHLVKHYTSPDNIRYEVTNDTILITEQDSTNEETEQQSISLGEIPLLHAFITAVRGVLSGDIENIREFFDLEFSASKLHWKIILTPKNESTKKQISTLTISGRAEQVLRIEIKETSGDITVTHIYPDDTFGTSQNPVQ